MRLTILRFDEIDSTNLEAMRQAKRGASEGLCIVAREQTAGRGRHERVWNSPRDAGLYLSVLLRPEFDKRMWPLITLMAAVAVANTLREACGLETDIKWPNDIVVHDQKLSGILAETVETNEGLACVLGIGINLLNDAITPELQPRATSIAALVGKGADAEKLLIALLEHLARHYDQLGEADGAAAIVRHWTAASSFAVGKPVRVDTGTEVFEGQTSGLQSDGALCVQIPGGATRVVHAGDVQFLRPLD